MSIRIGRHKLAQTSLKEEVVVESNATVEDIMQVILDLYEESKYQTVHFAKNFDFTTINGFEELFWDIKSSIKYKEDKPGFEIVKSPSALYKLKVGDCKSFTIASGSTMHNGGVKKIIFRLCHYGEPSEAHIYPIAYLGGRKIVMDSVHHTFNQEPPGKVWWMDYDPETRTVIREVGIRSKQTNDLMQKLLDAGIVIAGFSLLNSKNFVLKLIGGYLVISKIREYSISQS